MGKGDPLSPLDILKHGNMPIDRHFEAVSCLVMYDISIFSIQDFFSFLYEKL